MKRHIHIVVTLMVVMLISIFTGCEGAIGELPKETQGIIKTPEVTQLIPNPTAYVVAIAEKLNYWKEFQNLLKEDTAAYLEMISKLKPVQDYEAGELHEQAGTLYKYEEDYFFISDTREGYLLIRDANGEYEDYMSYHLEPVMKFVDVYPRAVVVTLPWGTIVCDEKDGKDQLELWILGERKLSLEPSERFADLFLNWQLEDPQFLETKDYIYFSSKEVIDKYSEIYFIKVDEAEKSFQKPYVISCLKWEYYDGYIYYLVGSPGSLRKFNGISEEYIEYDGVKDFYFEDGELKIIK